MLCLVHYLFVISTSVIDCLGRFVPEMTYYVSSGTLNLAQLNSPSLCVSTMTTGDGYSTTRKKRQVLCNDRLLSSIRKVLLSIKPPIWLV